MHDEKPFTESVDHWVAVWIGSLTEAEFEEYVDEPGGAGDDEPISEFGRDLGQWYDHDFLSGEATEVPVATAALCEGSGIEVQAVVDEIVARYPHAAAKSMLILWNARTFRDAVDRTFADGRLMCVGSWAHTSPLTDGYG